MGTFSKSFFKYFKQQSRKIISALKYLHENGLIHQDIKPKNIIVNPLKGDLSLIDFGLARPYNNDSPLDRTIAFTGGTSGYAPPEFAKDGKRFGNLKLTFTVSERCFSTCFMALNFMAKLQYQRTL